MIPYTGNGAYCYANSLHMSLKLANNHVTYSPAFLECLTTMPFGKLYLKTDTGRLFFPGAEYVDPDTGLSRAIETLGWICDTQTFSSDTQALSGLRQALADSPVLIGPVNMGCLTYMHGYDNMHGADHYVMALAVEGDIIRIHDPNGFPNVPISASDFMEAWQADGVFYRRELYTMRASFRKISEPSLMDMITQTIGYIRDGLRQTQSEHALRSLASDLRSGMSGNEQGHLLHFAFPLAARRLNDGAIFLADGDQQMLAEYLLRQSRLFGETLYPAVHNDWESVADIIEQISDIEANFVRSI